MCDARGTDLGGYTRNRRIGSIPHRRFGRIHRSLAWFLGECTADLGSCIYTKRTGTFTT